MPINTSMLSMTTMISHLGDVPVIPLTGDFYQFASLLEKSLLVDRVDSAYLG